MFTFSEWFTAQNKFSTEIQDMTKEELNNCLKVFYAEVRKQDSTFYKKSSVISIRAAIDRFLREKPHNKHFSIIADPAFGECNSVLNAVLKDAKATGQVAGTVHKKALTREHVNKLFTSGQLGPADSKDPAQLLRSVWFYISLYFGRRGRENQRLLQPGMLIQRQTPDGRSYFELNKAEAGAVLATKNHQGGLHDDEDESDGKIFEDQQSTRCPFRTIQSYLSHLNPDLDCLFQRPKDPATQKFNSADESVWYARAPLGENTLNSMLKQMCIKSGIEPYLTNHSIRATSVTILSNANCQTRHIKAITGHKSDQSIEAYNSRPSFEQQEAMSSILSDFVSDKTSQSSSLVVQGSMAAPPVSAVQNQVSQAKCTSMVNQYNKENVASHVSENGGPNNFFNCTVQIVNNNYYRSLPQ